MLPTDGPRQELRARLRRHLGLLDAERPVVCLNPGPLPRTPDGRGPRLPRPGPDYRLLRTLRGDETALAGFDQASYVAAGRFDARSLASVLDDFAAVRAATITLVRSAAPADFGTRLPVGRGSVTGVALAYLIAGHERHHQQLLRTRYLPCLPPGP